MWVWLTEGRGNVFTKYFLKSATNSINTSGKYYLIVTPLFFLAALVKEILLGQANL